jgi:flagellar L-ring protein precursor FlgH
MTGFRRKCYTTLCGLTLIPLLSACGPKSAHPTAATALRDYATAAKATPQPSPKAEGSLWVGAGRRSDLFRDFKARDVNDFVTIRVVESIEASATADASNSRNTEVTAGLDHFFGLEGRIRELPSLVEGKSSSSFEGTGATTRSSTLQTNLSARVTDVLPNGYLVVEAQREVRLNNETQYIYLTGVVRPEDINRENVVLSSAVAQMTVHVQGKGIVSQPLKPGWLYRILNGILPF